MRPVTAQADIELMPFDASGVTEYAPVFAAMRSTGAQALVITANPRLHRDRVRIADLALQTGLPTVCEWAEVARTGRLIGYGPSKREMCSCAAEYTAAYTRALFAPRKPMIATITSCNLCRQCSERHVNVCGHRYFRYRAGNL